MTATTPSMSEHGMTPRLRRTLINNVLAAGLSLGLAVLVAFVLPVPGLAICSAVLPFAVTMLVVSVAWSATIARSGISTARWLISVVISYALTAPVGTWFWNAVEGADATVTVYGPQPFIWSLWLWAIVPAVIYAAVGTHRIRKDSY